MQPYHVAILGATGSVGQRLIQRLDGHPWFRIRALAASQRSTGRPYREAAEWRLSADPPAAVADLPVVDCALDALRDCDLALSGLDTDVAREVEPALADAGIAVISNSSAFRQHDDVPLLIPEVNAAHVALLERQASRRGGFIATNPNCSVTGLALALAPIHRAFGLKRAVVATLQALSGAGMSGPRAIEMTDNVVPFIAGEEDKMERELTKIFGTVEGGALRRVEVAVSAHCHRVATIDGHLEAVSFETARPAGLDEVRRALEEFRGDVAGLGLPGAPERPIVLRDEPDRPQPRLDRDAGGGMAVTVGRLRACPVLGTKLELLSHNTLRGAAGGTVLNAELFAAEGRLPRRGSA